MFLKVDYIFFMDGMQLFSGRKKFAFRPEHPQIHTRPFFCGFNFYKNHY